MNYNLIVIISLIICAIISMLLSYYLVSFILDEDSGLFKVSQLVIAIVSMTTFYAPIKHILIKYMDMDDEIRTKDD